MKIRSLISMAMAAVMVAACSYEDELSVPLQKGMLTASGEGSRSTTRAGFDGEGKFYWSTPDYLGVTTSNSTTSFSKLELKTGGGTASATFEGTVSGTIEGYAVYPYNDKHAVNSTTLTYNFPSSYTYTKVDGDYFTTTQGEGNSFNPAMWGSIVNGSVQLKHLGGVFCIKIEKMPVTEGKLTLTTDKKIAGDYTVDLDGETPALVAVESSDEDNTVAVTFSGATLDSPGVFYVPVPTGTYNSVRVKVLGNDDSEKANVAAGTYTIVRQDLKRIVLSNGSIDVTVPTLSTTLAGAATALGTSDAVSVTGEISSTNNEIAIPSVSSTGGGTSKSLSLEQVASGASLTVTDTDTGDATNSVDNFTLSIPNNETTDFEPLDVTITMPNTTVTLAGNAGVATYGTVTASTADNTLILSSGVKVGKVIVTKGNIRVNKGATLSAIEKSVDNTAATVTIYKEEGATLPTSIPEGFEVVDAAIADMKDVFANGGTYTLQNDLNIVGADMTVAAGVAATLDLNGYTITAENTQTGNIEVYGTLTLKDGTATAVTGAGTGKIITNSDYTGASSGYALVKATGESAKIIMESGYIYAVRNDAVNKGQFAIGVDAGGDFTMTGGKIEAGWYAVSGNGNNKTQNSVIEIKGGELISTSDYAIYLPHSGEATISGGTVNGAAGAVSIQRGTLNISNDANIMSQGNGDTGEWGDGTGNQPNCAVMVAAKYGDCTVNITSGNFSAEGDAILLGTGSTSYNVDINVSGGTFSDPSALAYLTENANVNVVLNKNYTLTAPIQCAIGGKVVMDFNKKTLIVQETTSDWLSVSKGVVTIKNGNIEANQYANSTTGGVVVSSDASLFVESITYQSTGAALFVKDKATLNVTDTEITVPAYAVTTNASNPDQSVTINLSNSTFTSSDPVLLNIPSDVTIDDCTMSGTMHGMVLRGGTAVVKNSTITLNYPDDDYEGISSYFDNMNWGSGNMVNIAALTIGNKSSNAYQYPTNITLENTTIQSIGSYASYFPALYAYANSGDGLGVTLKYDNQCTFTGGIKYGSTNITVNESPVSPESNN